MNFQITHLYVLNINSGCDTVDRVFKLCLNFTLSPFECNGEDILVFEGEITVQKLNNQNDAFSARCKVCSKTISIAAEGVNALELHEKSMEHKTVL